MSDCSFIQIRLAPVLTVGQTINLLRRKEVIQPHLPIRLPCYDFTPIIHPTFGGWPPYGLPHRLRVLSTLVV